MQIHRERAKTHWEQKTSNHHHMLEKEVAAMLNASSLFAAVHCKKCPFTCNTRSIRDGPDIPTEPELQNMFQEWCCLKCSSLAELLTSLMRSETDADGSMRKQLSLSSCIFVDLSATSLLQARNESSMSARTCAVSVVFVGCWTAPRVHFSGFTSMRK